MMIASFRSHARLTALLFAMVAVVGLVGLTDAVAGEVQKHKIMKKLDPAALATIEKLDRVTSLELTNASLSELLSAVSNATGLVVTQDPGLATHAVQNARFTLKADNVPVHMVLMEALKPFQLAPEPSASGVSIVEGPERIRVMHGGEGEFEDEIVIDTGDGKEQKHVMKMRKAAPAGADAGNDEMKTIMVKVNAETDDRDDSGTVRRKLSIDIDRDGVKTVGTLEIEIQR
jgi:hypothetical protein